MLKYSQVLSIQSFLAWYSLFSQIYSTTPSGTKYLMLSPRLNANLERKNNIQINPHLNQACICLRKTKRKKKVPGECVAKPLDGKILKKKHLKMLARVLNIPNTAIFPNTFKFLRCSAHEKSNIQYLTVVVSYSHFKNACKKTNTCHRITTLKESNILHFACKINFGCNFWLI